MSIDREFGMHCGWTNNIESDPDACGLTLVASFEDPKACYDFHTMLVLRDKVAGGIYTATDEGCSCPVPFENYKRLSDLAFHSSPDTVIAAFDEWNKKWDGFYLNSAEAHAKIRAAFAP